MFSKEVISSYFGYKRLYENFDKGNYLDNLLYQKRTRFDPDAKINAYRLNDFDIGLSYIIYAIKNDPNVAKYPRMQDFRDRMFDYFKKYPLSACEFPIFRDNVRDLLFTDEQLDFINNYRAKRSASLNEKMKKLKNGNITEEDLAALIFAAQGFIQGNMKDSYVSICEKLYSYLISSDKDKYSLLELEFIVKYTAYLNSKDLGIPLYPVSFTDYTANKTFISDDVGGYSIGGCGIIHLNRGIAFRNECLELADDMQVDYITDIIHIISHENRHSAQNYKSRKAGYVDEYAFDYAVHSIIRTYYPDEYHRNYSRQQTEIDAEHYGWRFVSNILTKYNPNKKRDIERSADRSFKKLIDKSLAFKTNENNGHSENDLFDLVKADEIIGQHPELLNTYPILKEFYDSRGKRKSFLDEISDRSAYKHVTGFNTVKERFLQVDITHYKILNQIDVDKMTIEQKYDFYHGIINTLEHLKNDISKGIDSVKSNSNRQGVFFNINRIRTRTAFQLWDYIGDHLEDILDIHEQYKKRGENSMFLIRLGAIRDYYGMLSEKIQKVHISDNEMINELLDSIVNYDYDSNMPQGRRL